MVGKNRNKNQLNNGLPTTTNISRKSKIRYLLVRGENYEKQMADLLQSLSLYARRNGKLRDAGDIY
ncbi:FAM92B-like protein [Euroglyphus maynei]|uniref:FAM92B-like protein n=1 Tax=Euroglyphus maynei TaxID=6958 RepID=A0A1Y3B4E3_EURMA|nr:FAM92B-like protein [Euroglyphus maynei]